MLGIKTCFHCEPTSLIPLGIVCPSTLQENFVLSHVWASNTELINHMYNFFRSLIALVNFCLIVTATMSSPVPEPTIPLVPCR